MAQWGVERRVAGIIRWLERFQNSYRSGALENALMDAECARADMEDLRLDIWSRVGEARAPRRFGLCVAQCAFSAILIILATAAPLSRLSASQAAIAVTEIKAAAPALPEASPAREAKEARKNAVQGKGASSSRRAAARAEPRAQKTAEAKRPPEKRVPYDKMFSLLQTGARALKNEESVIKIRETGKGEGKL